jgi:hypothetical protein
VADAARPRGPTAAVDQRTVRAGIHHLSRRSQQLILSAAPSSGTIEPPRQHLEILVIAINTAGRPLTFDPKDGTIAIYGLKTKIGPRLRTDALSADLAPLVARRRDHGNGWAWGSIEGLALVGERCTLSLGTFHGRVAHVSWGLIVEGEDYSSGWPSQSAMDKERALMIAFLTETFGPGPDADRPAARVIARHCGGATCGVVGMPGVGSAHRASATRRPRKSAPSGGQPGPAAIPCRAGRAALLHQMALSPGDSDASDLRSGHALLGERCHYRNRFRRRRDRWRSSWLPGRCRPSGARTQGRTASGARATHPRRRRGASAATCAGQRQNSLHEGNAARSKEGRRRRRRGCSSWDRGTD